MLGELLKHPKALLISLGLHLVVIGLMVVNFHFADRPEQIYAATRGQGLLVYQVRDTANKVYLPLLIKGRPGT